MGHPNKRRGWQVYGERRPVRLRPSLCNGTSVSKGQVELTLEWLCMQCIITITTTTTLLQVAGCGRCGEG